VEVDYFEVYGYAYANITVNPALSASVIHSTSTTPTTTTSVTFNITAIGGTPAYTYAWNFGDTYTGSGNATSHTFSAAGNYTVTVVITDAGGGRVTKLLVVTVTKAASSTSLLTDLTTGVGLFALVGVVVAVVVIALAVVMTRHKKGPASTSLSARAGPTTPDASAPTAAPVTPPPTPPPGAS
jgi:PKD repeat protein